MHVSSSLCCLLLLTKFGLLSQQTPTMGPKYEVKTVNNREEVQLQYNSAVKQFRNDFDKAKSSASIAAAKATNYITFVIPYLEFERNTTMPELFGLSQFAHHAASALEDEVRVNSISDADFARRAIARTTEVLRILELDESSLFVTPTTTSIPPGAHLVVFSLAQTKRINMLPDTITNYMRYESFAPGVLGPLTRGIYGYRVSTQDGGYTENLLDLVSGHASEVRCEEHSQTIVFCKSN